jgi:hypothetical protein
MNLKLNWAGILAAAVVAWLIGAAWYGFIFAEQWMSLTGVNAADKPEGSGTAAIALGFVQTLVMMTGLGWIISHTAGGWFGGLKTGLITAVLIALPVSAYNFIYETSAMGLLPIDWGHLLLIFAVGGALIGGVRVGRQAVHA